MMTLFVAVKAPAIPVFADLGSLPEANEESVIVQSLHGIIVLVKSGEEGVHFGHLPCWLGIMLSRADSIPVISLVSGNAPPALAEDSIGQTSTGGNESRHGIILSLFQQCPQQVQGGGVCGGLLG